MIPAWGSLCCKVPHFPKGVRSSGFCSYIPFDVEKRNSYWELSETFDGSRCTLRCFIRFFNANPLLQNRQCRPSMRIATAVVFAVVDSRSFGWSVHWSLTFSQRRNSSRYPVSHFHNPHSDVGSIPPSKNSGPQMSTAAVFGNQCFVDNVNNPFWLLDKI